MFLKKLDVKLKYFSIDENIYKFQKVEIQKPLVKVSSTEGDSYNFDFLIDMFFSESESEDSETIQTAIDTFIIENAEFIYRNETDNVKSATAQIDFDNLNIEKFNLYVTDIQYGDSFKLSIDSLNFREQSGFMTDSLRFNFSACGRQATISDFMLNTPFSKIDVPVLLAEFPGGVGECEFEFPQSQIHIYNSVLHSKDLAFFEKRFSNSNTKYEFYALGKKTGNTYLFDEINIESGKTILRTKASFYSNFTSDDFYALIMIDSFYTTPDAVRSFPIAEFSGDSLNIPNELSQIKYLSLQGSVLYKSDSIIVSIKPKSNVFTAEADFSILSSKKFTIVQGTNKINILQADSLIAVEDISVSALSSKFKILVKPDNTVYSKADFTHSICPECLPILYPDFVKRKGS